MELVLPLLAGRPPGLPLADIACLRRTCTRWLAILTACVDFDQLKSRPASASIGWWAEHVGCRLPVNSFHYYLLHEPIDDVVYYAPRRLHSPKGSGDAMRRLARNPLVCLGLLPRMDTLYVRSLLNCMSSPYTHRFFSDDQGVVEFYAKVFETHPVQDGEHIFFSIRPDLAVQALAKYLQAGNTLDGVCTADGSYPVKHILRGQVGPYVDPDAYARIGTACLRYQSVMDSIPDKIGVWAVCTLNSALPTYFMGFSDNLLARGLDAKVVKFMEIVQSCEV